MRKLAVFGMVLALAVTGSAMADTITSGHHPAGVEMTPAIKADVPIDRLRALYSAEELETQRTYVGDEFCIACHSWGGITRDVKHRQALRKPMGSLTLIAGRGVVADYDENGVDDFMQGLDFNTISSVFDPYIPNAPILSYNPGNDTYWITIGDVTSQVWITQGGTGDWKQRYLLRVPAGNGWTRGLYVSPVQYNERTHGYVAYHPENWYDQGTYLPLLGGEFTRDAVAAVGRQYSKKCIGCHTTGIRRLYEDSAGEWIYRPYPASLVYPDRAEQYPDYDQDGIPDIVNIGCEACHGPGSAHILGNGDPELILAPSELDTNGENEICEQCHVRVKSVPAGVFDWPRREIGMDIYKAWVPGVTEGPLDSFYTEADGRWPDGKHAKQHHQQNFDFYESSKPEFVFHPVRCSECHSPHRGGKHMIRTSIDDDGVTIPTLTDDNTLCLACHATHGPFEEITPEQVADLEGNLDHIADVVEAHTNHPYAPTRVMGLSRCTKCHMPWTAKSAINYDISSHTFEAIAPGKTLMYQAEGGMPNSCAVSCHSTKVNSFDLGMDPDLGVWDAQFDVDTAEALEYYFGPGGVWWDTDHGESKAGRQLRVAPAPGRYVSKSDPNDE